MSGSEASVSLGESNYGVAMVVDEAFGSRLIDLAARLHVWLIDTPKDRASAAELASMHHLGVTLYMGAPAVAPNELVASMLSTLDLHHGDSSQP